MRLILCLIVASHIVAGTRAAPVAPREGWSLISVPGATNFAGVGWYRAWVKVPDSYFTPHERNLFEESVGIYVEQFGGAYAVWINRQALGTNGSFPPSYRSATEQLQRHKVPVGTLRKGLWNEIAFRVYQPDRSTPSGFRGPAPFIMDYFLECVFAGPWEFRLGDDYEPGGARTNRPPGATFDSFAESSRVLGRAPQVHGPKLSPQESAAKLRPDPEFVAELLLHEPLIAQPTHFSFDERGRLWVAQYRQYPYPAGVKMVSRDKYYRAHYDKVPPPPPHHDRGADIISIHEDSDGDGAYDRHKVFLDGLNMANAVVRGRDGVWVMHTPYLLFYPDRDNDDKPDGPPQVRLAGFGLEDTHSVANGLVWGPDGWLYGAQGSTTSCRVTRPGLDLSDAPGVYFEGCMVWRYHPETRAFEIFAEGGGNTFGLELDADGRLFSGHNGADTRGWHFVQGGFYLMQGVDPGKFGPPRNPYAYGDLPMMRTTNQAVRFTHFGAFADGTAMPSTFAGRLFSLDPLHNVVLTSRRHWRGATFETADGEPALRSGDETFRPLYIANAPDGSLYVSDMCEFYIAHGQHYQNQIDPTSGRLYRLRGKDAPLEKEFDLANRSTEQLAALLAHPNKWHRHTAVRLLGERKDRSVLPRLRKWIEDDDRFGALNALWALYQITRFEGEYATIKKALSHPYAPVRAWTVRLLGDEYGRHRGLGAGEYGRSNEGLVWIPVYEALAAQADLETNREVLAQYASTARRLTAAQAMHLVGKVMAHEEVAGDPFIPQLCWWVFEAHLPPAPNDNDYITQLFHEPETWKMPVVAEYIVPRLARRYAVEGKRADLLRCAELFRLAPSAREASQLLKGLEEGFRGRTMSGLPEELMAAINATGQAPLLFRLRQGEAAAVNEALKVIENEQAPMDDRLQLVRVFGEVAQTNAVPILLRQAAGKGADSLRKAALTALSAYDDEKVGTELVALLPQLKGEVRTTALALLASRPGWSLHLLDTIETGATKPESLPEDVVSRLRSSRSAEVRTLAERVLPRPEPPANELGKRMDEIHAVLKGGSGNPYAGEAAFMQRCAACHKLFFKGGHIGPDLTAYQRDNLETMLISIVNPNAEIREGYQYYTVQTKDDRTLTGFFVERDNQVMVLRGLEGENLTLPSAEILEVEPMGRSLMPEGLLDGMTDQELRDLFAYLRISQPIRN